MKEEKQCVCEETIDLSCKQEEAEEESETDVAANNHLVSLKRTNTGFSFNKLQINTFTAVQVSDELHLQNNDKTI